MKKIGFIGAYNKTSLLMYIAKILTEMNKKVIIIDSTVNQRAKYVVPSIDPSTSYITTFEGIDISVGLYSYTDLENYLSVDKFDKCEYDYVLIDIDNPDLLEEFQIYNMDMCFFVTSFDLFSLKRGIEILSNLKMEIKVIKILFEKEILREDDEYLDFLSRNSKIEWNKDIIYFPFDNGDESIIIENQKTEKIKIKNLSSDYIDALIYLLENITNDKESNIKRIVKQIEKED